MKSRRIATAMLAAGMSVFASAFAGGVYDVRDFGAKGDGKTKDTAAIQAAIDAAAAAGGGEVFLGAGVYLSGQLRLKDDIDFHLGAGATLLGSPEPTDYLETEPYPLNYGLWPDESSFGAHFLVCYEKKRVTVRGPGKIDGNAKAFLVSPEGKVYAQHAIPWRPSQMLWFAQCEDVRVTDLEIANSTQWSCLFHGCDRVTVRGCRVHNNRFRRGTFHTHNGDGFDIDCSRFVSISDCDIDTADDAITLRASPRGPMKNRECAFVTVSNCRLSSECNAVRLGIGNGRIHDAVFSNLAVHETRIAFNFASSWSRNSRGCDFENIRFENCTLDCGRFLYIHPIYATEATIRNISLSGITGKSALPGWAAWNDPKLTGRLLLRDVELDCGLMTKNLPGIEITGGSLKKLEFPEGESGRREWAEDWRGYSNWGECNYDPRAEKKWKLVWSDEFDGTELDRGTWDYEMGVVRNPGTPHAYTDSPRNVRVENGCLVLEVHKERTKNPKFKPGSKNWKEREYSEYTSGSVTSLGKKSFLYGKIEIRAKVPLGRGMWPALWLMGENIRQYSWPRCGEFDLMEWVGSDPNAVFGTMHCYDPAKSRKATRTVSFGQRLEGMKPWDGFHIYAAEWDENSIVFLYDGIRYFTYDVNLATLHDTGPEKGEYNPFRKPMFIIMNLAMGGGWAGEVDDAHVPGQFLVDYIRFYERD